MDEDRNAPKVAVIIPSLDVAPYIRECLDSVLNQSLREIEVIVVDADSTDGTFEVLEEYSKSDSRITVLRDTKKSTGFAKNLGIERARAPYVFFVEPDDYIEKDILEILYENAVHKDLDVVKGGFNTFIGDGEKRFFFPKSVSDNRNDYGRIQNARENNDVFRWSMYEWLCLYKKDFLNKYHIRHNETPGAAFQDIGFCFLTLSLANSIELLDNTVYHYRCDNPNASVKDKKKVFNTCTEYKYISKYMEEYPDIWEKVKSAFVREYFHSNFVCYGRLSDDLKPSLSSRMNGDLITYNDKGMLDRKRFSEAEWRYVNTLLNSSAEFDNVLHRKEQIKEDNLNSVLGHIREIDNSKRVVICCAGFYGSNLQYLLKGHGIEVLAYADNNHELHGTYLNSVEILSYKECTDRFKDAVYLVANQNHGDIIRTNLEKEYMIPANKTIVVDCDGIIRTLI